MRLKIFLILCICAIPASGWAGGDTIELRDGTVVSGDIVARANATNLSGQAGSIMIDAAEIWIATPDGIKKIPASDIKTIRFGSNIVPAQAPAVPAENAT